MAAQPLAVAARPSVAEVRPQGRGVATFQALRYRDFRLIWIGQLGWSGSLWMEQVAVNWLVWQLTGSAMSLALVNAIRALPAVVIALPAGVAADRFNERTVLLASQWGQLFLLLALTASIAVGWLALWQVYAFSFLSGVVQAFNQPARQSLVTRLVPPEELMNAQALNRVAVDSVRVLGPALAGLLIAWHGVAGAMVAATAIFVTAVVATLYLNNGSGAPEGSGKTPGQELGEGLKFVATNKAVLGVMVVALGTWTFGFPFTTVLPVLATQVYGVGAGGYGLLLSAAGIGALVGAIGLATVGNPQRKGGVFIGGSVLFGMSLAALGLMPWLAAAFVLMALVGAAQSVFLAAGNAVVLSEAPRALQGRVMSVYHLDRALLPLGASLTGGLADAVSAPVALMVLGSLCMTVTLTVTFMVAQVRRL